MYLGVLFFCCVVSWPSLVSTRKLSACACFLPPLTARVFSRTVTSLHALRFFGWLGTVETFPPTLSLVILYIPSHPLFSYFECVLFFFLQTHSFSILLPGIWQLILPAYGPGQ